MHIALIALLVLAGGISFAANGAGPDDALYPVKVNVNERLGTAFSFGTETKAERELELADRRLEEAERLAAEGKLDAEAMARIQAGFTDHAENTRESILRLQAEGNTQAAAALSAEFAETLRIRGASLVGLFGSAGATTSAESKTATETDTDAKKDANATTSAGVKLEL